MFVFFSLLDVFFQHCGLLVLFFYPLLMCLLLFSTHVGASRRWTGSFSRGDRRRRSERERNVEGYESGDVGCVKMGGWCFLLPIHQCHSCWGCWCWWWCRLAAGHLCEAASSHLSCPGHAPPQSYESSSWERSLEWLKRHQRESSQKLEALSHTCCKAHCLALSRVTLDALYNWTKHKTQYQTITVQIISE